MNDKKLVEILFQNNEIIAVNKPSGIAVQGGEGIKTTILDIIEKQEGFKPYLVHRLDKDTSGILLMAKSSQFANKFTNMFKEESGKYTSNNENKKIKKYYWAICHGNFTGTKGQITEDIYIKGIKKKAFTNYYILKKLGGFSLIELELFTGRMHQIRIHLAKTNHPVIGDDKYGNFKLNRELKKTHNVKKLMLFSKRLEINDKKTIKIEADIPEYFKDFLKIFGEKI
ncbi:MAG: RNA pseudouridine synthase [Spirochaetes bacterium]|nr:RNA pseudouridine synthase [Spirochaetota bacterium]